MIKINLIPTKRKKKAKPIPMYIILVMILLGAGIVGYLYTGYLMQSKINDLKAKKEANAKKIAELQERIKEVKDFEALNKLYNDRKNIIEQLRKNQSLPARVLDEMSNQIPENVWLKSLDIKGKKITISCVGFAENDAVTFVQNLKGSSLFENPSLQELKQTSIQAKKKEELVYDFKVVVEVKT